MSYKATWEKFEYLNENKTKDFENLCRLLFKRSFFDKKTIFQSVPSNPGIEVLPIYSKELNKRISFQSKYFISEKNKYAEIKKSAEATIKRFNAKIDVVYLYSNKDLNLKCKQYEDMGDAWGISELDDVMGTSVVIVNSQRGKELFDRIKTCGEYELVQFEKISNGNPSMLYSVRKTYLREDFIKKQNKRGIKKTYKDTKKISFLSKLYIKLFKRY